jgi:nucleotide-binding universal stress UspA family protein
MNIPSINKILVPFDFSDQFNCTLVLAKEIAVKTGGKITIIHAFSNIVSSEITSKLLCPVFKYTKIITQKKQQILNKLHKEEMMLLIDEVVVKLGSWNNIIIQDCIQNKFDLIIAPNFSKNVFERLFSTINVLDIIEKTKIPVISINKNFESYSLNKIVLPIRDVDNWFDKIPFTTAIAKFSNAKIFIIGLSNVNSQQLIEKLQSNINYCKSYLSKFGVEYECCEKFSDKANYEDVILLAQYKQADLIVISPPLHYYKFKSYFNNNFYNKITATTNIPVMGHTLI